MTKPQLPKLRVPLRPMLDQPLAERDVQRIWRNIQDGRPTRTPWRAAWFALCVAGAVAVSAGWLLIGTRRGLDSNAVLAIRDEQALSSGRVLGDADRATSLTLNDGSHLELQRDTSLAVIENSPKFFRMQLQHGSVEFDVTPGGPRHWQIDCGHAAIEVIGTRFVIERNSTGVRVRVSRGVVDVRSLASPTSVRRLGAGQEVYVAAPPTAAKADSLAEVTSEHTLAALLQDADAARLAHQNERASALLERVMVLAPDSPHAEMAALTLARIVMSSDPARAVTALRTVRVAQAPEWLREDVLTRLVEAYARAGQHELAAQVAAEYARDFPAGRYRAEVQRWAAIE